MRVRWFDETYWYEGSTAVSILAQMKRDDWHVPKTVYDFKINVARRCTVLGETLLFWDATSFLLALENAGKVEIKWDLENSDTASL
tara:strand:+ start:131 stop:388 length:258 start_codon:yes stop_codon:yes gene_type:complete